jgi:glyoxylase-like metal-dependent hydrolase (beta-lactamase superfamily II)
MIKTTKLTPIFLSVLLLVACRERKEYQVYAIKFSDGYKIAANGVMVGATQTDSVDVCNMFWLISGPNRKYILVDAGFIDSTKSSKNYVRPDSMLQKLGISSNEISNIILTHPHIDHIGGIPLFPKATIWMQKDDYNYFIGPAWDSTGIKMGFNKNDVKNISSVNSQGRLVLVQGDSIEIMPGIRVFTGSKHTFENQYLLVNADSKKNRILLASDAIWFYLNYEKDLPVTICMDRAAYVKAMKRMRTMVTNPNLIIPGHDDMVFLKFPKVHDWIVRIEE